MYFCQSLGPALICLSEARSFMELETSLNIIQGWYTRACDCPSISLTRPNPRTQCLIQGIFYSSPVMIFLTSAMLTPEHTSHMLASLHAELFLIYKKKK